MYSYIYQNGFEYVNNRIFQGTHNQYGHHPYYNVIEDDDGNSHSVLFFNSNAMGM